MEKSAVSRPGTVSQLGHSGSMVDTGEGLAPSSRLRDSRLTRLLGMFTVAERESCARQGADA